FFCAGRRRAREVCARHTRARDVRDLAVKADMAALGDILDRGERWHVPDHRQRAVFGGERNRALPLHRHLPDRRQFGRFQPVVRNAVGLRLSDHRRVIGVQEYLELLLVEILLVLGRGDLLDAVGIIEDHAEIADGPDAGFGADGRQASLDPRIAEDALLGLPAFPVVIDLLVRAAADAHPPTAALVLVDEDDAVLLALVDRTRRAGGDARRVEAVLAQPRKIEHEGLLKLAVGLLLDVSEVRVLGTLLEFAAENLLPVRPPFDLLHALAGDG